MGRILAFLLTGALCSAAAPAVSALAASPDSGTVSGAAPSTAWAGGMDGDRTGAILDRMRERGGTHGYCEDDPLAICDVYTLTVQDPGRALAAKVTADGDSADMAVEIVDPAGRATYVYEQTTTVTAAVQNPVAGRYVINVLGAPRDPVDVVTYKGAARLHGARVPPPPPPPPPPPAPASEPPPASEPAPAPASDRPAAERSLAIQPDRRRLGRAARFGFRTRVICRGGCAQVELRVFVSSLTARQLRLGDFSGDVQIGGAPILRDAEGRRQARVTFMRRLRKRLLRSRRLRIAIEAVATDPDGRTRTHFKRMTLRR